MRKIIRLKFIASILLLVMLAVAVNGAHESAHALHISVKSASASATVPTPGADDIPCTPFDHQQDYDGCDICCNCACHASLTILPFQLSYNPVVAKLHTFDLFESLPEVYLSKFVPPQI